ncbi:MAG: EAL domain-containing protein [Trueperaceae bacterium]|nr:EAL domain-containing protein [Trueperaceae bacterium]
MRNDRDRRLARMDAFRGDLLDLIREALATVDPEAFHRHLLERAVSGVTGAQAGALMLRDDATDAYRFVATVGYDLARPARRPHPTPLRGLRTSRGGPHATHRPVAQASSARAGGRGCGRPDRVRARRRDRVGADRADPSGDRIRAFLTLDSFDDDDAFDAEAVEMGRIFAGHVEALLQRFDLEADLQRLAFHDPLTGLPNRTLFLARLERRLADPAQGPWAILYLDLDNLKPINDSFGHQAGDEAIRMVAQRISELGREGHEVSRLGGDEFAVVVDGSQEEAHQVAQRLLASVQRPMAAEGHTVYLGASIGIGLYPEHGASATDLMRRADVAMYQAKTRLGRNAVVVFEPTMEAAPLERLLLEEALRRALAEDQFVLHFQPRVSASTGRIRSLEALVRWQHPERGLVSPGVFIPLAERTRLIHPLGRYILDAAAREARRWRELGFGDLRIAVNLAAKQLERDSFQAEIEEVLGQVGLPAQAVEFEVTESVAMMDVTTNAARLSSLKDLGATVALDDFGMGHSSLAYLRDLPVDVIKIDRTFLSGLENDDPNRAIVGAITLLGKSLGRTVVAEGVETREQWDAVREIGVDEAQGFLLARPMPREAIDRLLEHGDVLLP